MRPAGQGCGVEPLPVETAGALHVRADEVRALAESGEPVRGLVRGGRENALPEGVEAVAGDLNQPASLRAALLGVSGVFLLPGYQDMAGVLEEIGRSGAQRVVLLSGSSAADGDMSNAITRYMIVSENAVRDSGLPWTILRPSGFASNALQWVPQLRTGDRVRAPFGGVKVTVIDPYDIAAVAARALTSAGHEGRTYRLTGPEPTLPADRVQVLGSVLGRDLRFEAQPDAEARAEMSAAMPAEYVDAFFSFYADGTLDESVVLPTVLEVTGTPPRTFQQWASAHAGAFR
jgi:uncharacterized protein YbjT (DUF2867 family)